MPASTWKILTLKLFALRPNCLLLARSDIRVVLQHPGQVLIVSLKPSLFLRGRLFPSLNGGLQEKVKTEMTATQSSDTGRIYERCSKGMQGFVTFPLFLNPTSHTHTPIHSTRPNHKHQPAVSLTVKCVYFHLERMGWHNNLPQLHWALSGWKERQYSSLVFHLYYQV